MQIRGEDGNNENTEGSHQNNDAKTLSTKKNREECVYDSSDKSAIIIDSGASEHVFVHKKLFEFIKEVDVVQVELADESIVMSRHK